MGLKDEIKKLVSERKKILKRREKVYYKHCKKCGYGFITHLEAEAREWDRIHADHKEKSILEKVWGVIKI